MEQFLTGEIQTPTMIIL